MGRAFLGEFEQRVLLAILRCDAKATPIEIRREVLRASGHEPSRGAFYTTLDRLEGKGLLRSWEGAPTAQRGGRRRKFYGLRPAGITAMRHAYHAFRSMADGLEGHLEPK